MSRSWSPSAVGWELLVRSERSSFEVPAYPLKDPRWFFVSFFTNTLPLAMEGPRSNQRGVL